MKLILQKPLPPIVCEEQAFPGVRRVCSLVAGDLNWVFGERPAVLDQPQDSKTVIFAGTIGKSPLLEQLNHEKKLDLSGIRGKWEVFSFQLVEDPFPGVAQALVIAGSDKRGTIYGLFHLSELLGVSPLVDWAEVRPARLEQYLLDESCCMVSREPSVRYRGIFINDEWPAIGTWAKIHFGGFNAKMYLHVFQLILRLKGNYLWPAMWDSNFSLDGPGIENARLADELGIVMGTSHHEPCMRAGEEYGQMRGPNSPYGDAWNFLTNREGITRFWEDGLRRNRPYENIITVGMRGEQDTPIMGANATLQDNIDLLRDVLRTQNQLIRRCIGKNLAKIPRLFVLFTEVEKFYYGDETTKGLMDDPELDGVTLMLTDDNFGNLRSLPTEEMKNHPGGFGLYYHLDFHGGAYAYDWMNTNFLPKIWEQLTCAYEGGIREVWIANIGDICFLEYPLCFFMDMAYDMDKWGAQAVNQTDNWSRSWVNNQFGSGFSREDCGLIDRILHQYTQINHNRKPEVMNVNVYHPVHFGETQMLLETTKQIMADAKKLLGRCPPELTDAFWELVYYPASASANHCQMWLYAGLDQFYASQGRMEANQYAHAVRCCIGQDRMLTEQYHALDGGRFSGMALSEHVGFVRWCEDGNLYPPFVTVEGANKPRLLVADARSDAFTIGTRWSGDTLELKYGLNQNVNRLEVDLACGSRVAVSYLVETDCPWLSLSRHHGCVKKKDVLTITIHRERMEPGVHQGTVTVKTVYNACHILVWAEKRDTWYYPSGTFVEANHILCMEAAHYAVKSQIENAGYEILSPYGRTGSAIKAFPVMEDFTTWEEKPWAEYRFAAQQEGEYTLELYVAPSNTATMEHKMNIGIQMNEEEMKVHNLVGSDFASLKLDCLEWDTAVRDNIRISKVVVACRKGLNQLRLYAMSPMAVIERIVLHPADSLTPESYLGPPESWQVK